MNEWDEYAVLEAELGARVAAELMVENAIVPELRATVILRKLEDANPTPKSEDNRPDIVGWYVGLDGQEEKGNTYEITGVHTDGRLEATLVWPDEKDNKKVTHWYLPPSRIDWGWDPDTDGYTVDPDKLDKLFSDREAT